MANYSKKRNCSATAGKSETGKTTSRNYTNGRKRDSKSKMKDESVVRSEKLSNDPEWYMAYPELVESTCKLVDTYPLGININIGDSQDPHTLNNSVFAMRLSYVHGIGPTEKETDAVNLAATRIYSFVRHANSGHANYEKTDLMLYFLAVTEVYNMIAYAERAYGLCFMYNSQNRMLPARMLSAAGWNYDDITANLNLLRSYINTAIARVNSLYVPAEMRVAKRWWWMNSNVFVDSPNPKAYAYIYTPMVYRTYEELETPKLGYLKANTIPDSFTVQDWYIAVTTMLNKLFASEDIGIISGDILKAYGSNVFTLPPMEEFHSVPFIYSEEVLTQINNTRLCPSTPVDLDITQVVSLNGSNLKYLPAIQTDNVATFERTYGYNWMINVQGDKHTPVDNMIATRNIWTIWGVDNDNKKIWLNCGSEIIVLEEIYTSGSKQTVHSSYANSTDLGAVLYHTQFDYAPLLVTIYTSNPKVVSLIAGGSRYDNLVPIAGMTLGRIHDVALLSLFTAIV